MRWFGWFRRKPIVRVAIQPFRLPDDFQPLRIPKDPAYVVTEAEMSKTGMFRMFPWLKKEASPDPNSPTETSETSPTDLGKVQNDGPA